MFQQLLLDSMTSRSPVAQTGVKMVMLAASTRTPNNFRAEVEKQSGILVRYEKAAIRRHYAGG